MEIRMEILTNTLEMARLFENYNNAVKEEYKTTSELFAEWVASNGTENTETEEYYIEIPSNETVSGNPVILDW
jgi:hypothetical protein